MTREELMRIGDAASVGVAAAHDAYWQGDYLEPRLWEALRIELQRRFRRSTGETMAVLSIDHSPRPSSEPAVGSLPDAGDIELLQFAISRLPEEWQTEGRALLEKISRLSDDDHFLIPAPSSSSQVPG